MVAKCSITYNVCISGVFSMPFIRCYKSGAFYLQFRHEALILFVLFLGWLIYNQYK